jgi:predicted thioredoxin/glutaredoxin
VSRVPRRSAKPRFRAWLLGKGGYNRVGIEPEPEPETWTTDSVLVCPIMIDPAVYLDGLELPRDVTTFPALESFPLR